MAGRVLNRRELRKQSDQAEQQPESAAPAADGPAEAPPEKKARAKRPAAAKVRKPRAKKAPPRMRARWGVFDGAMKQVAVFDYNQRPAAEAKVAELLGATRAPTFCRSSRTRCPNPNWRRLSQIE